MEVNAEHSISISEFYKGKNVFITGATGFLGKVLIFKLLQDCPDIGNIYILVRPKKGKDLKERVELLLQDMLFDTLKATAGHQLSKLIPIRGDCLQLKLGLSETDYETITSSVSIIYHVAASVRFDDYLKEAILLNIRGTRELAQLALQTPGLSVLVHVSTTYCNCVIGRKVEEQIYPAPYDWRNAIKIAEEFNSDQLAVLSRKYIHPYPNTYTFAKALGEHVIQDLCEGKIPTVICRPSIVLSTLNDPVKGWIDNFNGPVALLVACGKGLFRCDYQDNNIKLEYIPVDITIKAIIGSSWHFGLKQQRNHVEVIHCSSGKFMSIGNLLQTCKNVVLESPLNDCVWIPKGDSTRCRFYAYFCAILFHLLPAFFLDLGLKLMGKKPQLMNLQKKIYNAALQLRYFSWQEWDFCTDNFTKLQGEILKKDQKTWGFENTENFDLYVKDCIIGARKYLLHESEESMPAAKIHLKRMYWLDKFTMLILYGSVLWFILYFGIIEKIGNYCYNSVSYYFGRI